ncbi:iron chelate uptake ABC transporter family permease subunit, partial [Asanoa sp. NPDC050611]|uniref:iron chelate uptake ABC transporter family permease subunit n=1 Tax=Asanoa sp. NPDC050611 TaxID=3157098 RepID=UPI00340AB0CC
MTITASKMDSQAAHALRATRRRRTARSTTVMVGLAVLVFALFVVTMMIGSFRIGALDVVGSVLHLTENPSVDFVVRELRLPTALAGLGVGLALGASGTVFQQLLRNPLASPDFVGITSGAGARGLRQLQRGHAGHLDGR